MKSRVAAGREQGAGGGLLREESRSVSTADGGGSSGGGERNVCKMETDNSDAGGEVGVADRREVPRDGRLGCSKIGGGGVL